MFSRLYTRWLAAPAIGLALAASVMGTGSASAETLVASLTPVSGSTAIQVASDGNVSVPAGTIVTVQSTAFEDDEDISLWINVPAGVTIPDRSLGQDDTQVVDGVIPLDEMGAADYYGNFTYSVDTTGLPNGTYSLVAHGLDSGAEEMLVFTITGAPPLQLTASGDTTVAAGTVLTVQGKHFQANEDIGMWINVPAGVTIPQESLGQDDTYVDGTVIPLEKSGSADGDGVLTYSLDTSGLPAGNYSLVAHGLSSGLEEVLTFTIR